MAEELAIVPFPERDFRERNRAEFGFPYKFSIVMAVYNVELFLREAIDSVLAQDIGFEENVQLILVDDGSPDSSGEICDEYQKRFPENIMVIHKENGGVSSARNAGLKLAEGRYLNFMDSDDKFTENVLSSVYNFFIQHEEETDVVCIPHKYFGDLTGEPFQNRKFKKGTRLINLQYDYKAALMTVNNSFIRSERKKDIEFDLYLSCGEDLKVILVILLDKMNLGVVTGCRYMYRRILGSNSLINTSSQKKSWYLDHLGHLTYWVHHYCLKHLGYYPLFAQYNIMYDLQWKFLQKEIPRDLLTEQEKASYIKSLIDAASLFDDQIIKDQSQIWIQHKIFLLEQKYHCHPNIKWIKNNGMLYYNNTTIGWLSVFYTRFDFIYIKDGKLTLEGFARMAGCSEDEAIEVFGLVNNEEKIVAQPKERMCSDYCCGQLLFRGIPFFMEIPLNTETECLKIQIFCKFRGHSILKKDLRFGSFSPISKSFSSSYYVKDGWALSVSGSALQVHRCGRRGGIQRERAFLKELWKSKKESNRKAVKARLAYHVLKRLIKKPIWLISDRINKADDNGEAFFRYVNEHHSKEIDSYFVLSKDSPDYERMSKIGKVVDHLSFKHKLLFLLCEANISSQADDITNNPFQSFFGPYRDLLVNHKLIFLQHGVIQNDLSSWLNRYNKNLTMFVTTTIPEYESILAYSYNYDTNVVKLTGLPRHDRLFRQEKKMVTIMPTWRKYLVGGTDSKTGKRTLNSAFKDSRYYRMYYNLLNCNKLFDAAEETGYQIRLFNHPNMLESKNEITHDPRLLELEEKTSYRTIFAESDLLITDYSSVAFDFAYLRKPIIYYQQDKEDFFSGMHTVREGYFDYEQDGFGEVEYSTDALVNRIIEYMENGCTLKNLFRSRIDDTFPFSDRENCKRVYQQIIELRKE